MYCIDQESGLAQIIHVYKYTSMVPVDFREEV